MHAHGLLHSPISFWDEKIEYDVLGNIVKRDGGRGFRLVRTYDYGENGGGPHAVSGVVLAKLSNGKTYDTKTTNLYYDARGNVFRRRFAAGSLSPCLAM